ncbi:MAG: hypothetical protein HOM77_01545 [Planctomycetes bacterium]|nr:hypothetical protein [Planctomycetota bacterium]
MMKKLLALSLFAFGSLFVFMLCSEGDGQIEVKGAVPSETFAAKPATDINYARPEIVPEPKEPELMSRTLDTPQKRILDCFGKHKGDLEVFYSSANISVTYSGMIDCLSGFGQQDARQERLLMLSNDGEYEFLSVDAKSVIAGVLFSMLDPHDVLEIGLDFYSSMDRDVLTVVARGLNIIPDKQRRVKLAMMLSEQIKQNPNSRNAIYMLQAWGETQAAADAWKDLLLSPNTPPNSRGVALSVLFESRIHDSSRGPAAAAYAKDLLSPASLETARVGTDDIRAAALIALQLYVREGQQDMLPFLIEFKSRDAWRQIWKTTVMSIEAGNLGRDATLRLRAIP